MERLCGLLQQRSAVRLSHMHDVRSTLDSAPESCVCHRQVASEEGESMLTNQMSGVLQPSPFPIRVALLLLRLDALDAQLSSCCIRKTGPVRGDAKSDIDMFCI